MKQKNHKLQRDFTFLTLSMFVLVCAWIGFNIYHTQVTSTISEDLIPKIEPINPKFDTATIEQLKNRSTVLPAYDTPVSSTAAEEKIVAEIDDTAEFSAQGEGTQEAELEIIVTPTTINNTPVPTTLLIQEDLTQ